MNDMTEEKMEMTKNEVNRNGGAKKTATKKAPEKQASAKKAVVKKEAAKKTAAPKKAAAKDENVVTLAELTKEAKLKGTVARAKLRAAGLKCEGRWQWKNGSGDLTKARKALGLS